VQLRRENHRWWWRSFFVPGGGAAIGLIIIGITMPDLGPSIHHAPMVVLAAFYGGLLAIACGVLCVYGFVGVVCTLMFNKLLYAFVKEKEELSDSHVSMVEMVSATLI
jgi:cell division protein FtsW (lipid II flippase)